MAELSRSSDPEEGAGNRRQLRVANARCAIARDDVAPTLLMLDEPSVGLSPVMTERVFETIRSLVDKEPDRSSSSRMSVKRSRLQIAVTSSTRLIVTMGTAGN